VVTGGLATGAASYIGGALTVNGAGTFSSDILITGGDRTFYTNQGLAQFGTTGAHDARIIAGGGIAATFAPTTFAATFAGAVTVAGNLTVNGGTTASGQIGLNGTHGVEIWGKAGTTSSFILYNNAGASVLTNPINTTTATFAGEVAIANTVSSVSPTSPNRTITMVVGGVTLYIAAKTTND